jgi:hypothetical protein
MVGDDEPTTKRSSDTMNRYSQDLLVAACRDALRMHPHVTSAITAMRLRFPRLEAAELAVVFRAAITGGAL